MNKLSHYLFFLFVGFRLCCFVCAATLYSWKSLEIVILSAKITVAFVRSRYSWKRYHKSHKCASFEPVFYLKSPWRCSPKKYLLLKCTMNRDVFKRTCLIGAFMQPILGWDFKSSFWVEECKIAPLIIAFDKDILQPQKGKNI